MKTFKIKSVSYEILNDETTVEAIIEPEDDERIWKATRTIFGIEAGPPYFTGVATLKEGDSKDLEEAKEIAQRKATRKFYKYLENLFEEASWKAKKDFEEYDRIRYKAACKKDKIDKGIEGFIKRKELYYEFISEGLFKVKVSENELKEKLNKYYKRHLLLRYPNTIDGKVRELFKTKEYTLEDSELEENYEKLKLLMPRYFNNLKAEVLNNCCDYLYNIIQSGGKVIRTYDFVVKKIEYGVDKK